jgi:2-keto-4-pentenoate hydratase/2-oxohepta-3-ene-1,7-dioic acid hydratase in catechol pathway
MRLVTIACEGRHLPAVEIEAGVVALADLGPEMPDSVAGVIAGGAAMRAAVEARPGARPRPAGSYTLAAPIPRPAKNVFCVGKNYVDHAHEFQRSGFDQSSGGQNLPEVPIVFTKAPTSVTGPEAAVEARHDADGTLDYEGELAVVIGTGGRGIARAAAMDHVWGYTIVNDITARAAQNRHKQWFIGKSADGFCPMGPRIVSADELGEVTALRLTTRVNGELRQDACVRDLIFDIPTIIETISRAITLEPGDIIATGTPEGVAIGFTPPRYLVPGDTVEVEVTGIGVLRNRIV